MHALKLYPGSPPCSIAAIEADVVATERGCRARFVARGEIGRIALPERTPPMRIDDLWHTTCFELFWQAQGEVHEYVEFNLSPSTRWACYHFNGFRSGRTDLPARVTIDRDVSGDTLSLVADIDCALPLPACAALNAVIEDADGQNRFWALAFAPGPVQFHARECRTVAVFA